MDAHKGAKMPKPAKTVLPKSKKKQPAKGKDWASLAASALKGVKKKKKKSGLKQLFDVIEDIFD